MSQIVVPFKLHEAQREIFSNPKRFRVTCNGRRFGKTALGITELIIRGLSFKGKVDPKFPVTVLGVLPTANQAREVIWKPLYNILTSPGIDKLVKEINRTSMYAKLINDVQIKIVGANDSGGDRLRGLKLYFVWLDEAQDIHPIAFDEVIRPAMSDTPGSRALFTGTPKGKQNNLYVLSQNAEHDPDWAFFTYPTSANPTIPREEIERARLTYPARLFRQEYEANFVDFPGKIYSELGIDNKYFGDIPKLSLVVAGVDWGDLHPNISVLGRGIDRRWYYLEGWSPNADPRNAQPITDPVLHGNFKRLVKKWSIGYTYCDPSRPSSILAMRSLGSEPGYRNAIAGYNPIWEGIGQVHGLIKQKDLLFTAGLNDSVTDSLDGMEAYDLHEAYHRLTDKNGQFTDNVADGYFSHTCDATRYALATKVG
ncbi:MAG: hypothetical protein KME59_21415 [Trichormus sp. ATA11-4-KO1]|jgi:hypothetical protein|nr:hypothetical protein [Trichormus sp. ATA11-4-KO1]